MEKLTDLNYMDLAEKVMEKFDKNTVVSTNKIRNLLSMISDIYNDVLGVDSTEKPGSDELIMDIQKRIKYLKLKFVYEAGREEKTKEFIQEANILEYLNDIGSSKKEYLKFSRYMEALVAYRKYHFGDKE